MFNKLLDALNSKWGFPLGIILFALAFLAILMPLALWLFPQTPCTAAIGSEIQWSKNTGGKTPSYLVFLAIDSSKTTFCEVNNQELYNMGLGYRTSQPYTGNLINRP